jgi:putative ABC transport system substrate-binding protein
MLVAAVKLAVAIGLITALSVLAAPLAADAQRPGKIPRIGVLMPGRPPSLLLDAFRRGLRELGYVEGQTISIEYRWAEGKVDRLPSLAAELVGLKVDVIVTGGGVPGVHAAKRATDTIPIVFTNAADPVASGLVASLARPGGSVTGMATMSPEIIGKRLQLLKEAIPTVARVAILYNPAFSGSLFNLKAAQGAAPALGLTVQPLEVRSADEFSRAFAALTRERADALVAFGDPFTTAHQAQIVELAARSRLPAMYSRPDFAHTGGLMAYGPSLPDMYRRAATYVDKILKGAKPADLPVEQPTKFELVINLKTAKALGLTVPQSVLIRADQVIQ